MQNPPTLRAIVGVDFIALAAVLFPVVSLVLAGLAAMGASFDRWGRSAPSLAQFVIGTCAFAILGAVVLAWRVTKIRRAFAGTVVDGTITSIRAFKDRAYLGYRFVLANQTIETRHFVHLTPAVRALSAGVSIRVAVDPADESAAFVVDAFV